MTREEAQEMIQSEPKAWEVIDMIYDYFEQRIAELEAYKTCDGCKHIEEMGSCYDCSRYYIDYYEPKDKQ